MTDYAIFHR